MTTQAIAEKQIDGIEWGVVEGENTEFAAKYPRLQWQHGSKQAQGFMKTGGLFVSEDEYPNFTAEGFKPTTLITRDGTEIKGFAATSLNLAVIRIKHQWVTDEKSKYVPLAHVLCVAKGCDDLLNLSLKGPSKALDFQKIFQQHIGQNVALANRTRPEGRPAIEPFALWFPLQAGELTETRSKDGKSTSIITPIEMKQPTTLDRAYVASLWVGADNYKAFANFYKETAAWQKQPIWEQRNGEADDIPAFSGENGDAMATEGQVQHLIGICEAKGLDIKELCLTATNGGTNNPGMLSRAEANEIIETAKAY